MQPLVSKTAMRTMSGMSYATGVLLDAPDLQIQEIQRKLLLNEELTKEESRRWANRMSIEREIQRTGGTMKATAALPVPMSSVPRAPATGSQAPTVQPYAGGSAAKNAGRKETAAALDYQEGVKEEQRHRYAAPTGTQPPVRRSEISNGATVDEKIADNANGPHLGADGLPTTWNVPKSVSGRYNGGNLQDAEKFSSGFIAAQGADGLFKIWKGGKFTDERYASLEDAARSNPIPAVAEHGGSMAAPAASPGVPAKLDTVMPAPSASVSAGNGTSGSDVASVAIPALGAAALNRGAVMSAAQRLAAAGWRGTAAAVPHARAALTGYAIGSAVNNTPALFGSDRRLTDMAVDSAMGTYPDWLKEPITHAPATPEIPYTARAFLGGGAIGMYPFSPRPAADRAADAWHERNAAMPAIQPPAVSAAQRPVPIINIEGAGAAASRPVPVIDIEGPGIPAPRPVPTINIDGPDQSAPSRARSSWNARGTLPKAFQAAAQRFNPYAPQAGRPQRYVLPA